MIWWLGLAVMGAAAYVACRRWVGTFDGEAHMIEDDGGVWLRVYWRDRARPVTAADAWEGDWRRGPSRTVDPAYPFLDLRLAHASSALHRQRRRQERIAAKVAQATESAKHEA